MMAAPRRPKSSDGIESCAVHSSIRDYYSCRALRHGATPLGVDWTCAPTQELRFVQVLKVIAPTQALSVNDIGCGYGALAGFMHRRLRGVAIDYLGTDVSPEMIALARRKKTAGGLSALSRVLAPGAWPITHSPAESSMCACITPSMCGKHSSHVRSPIWPTQAASASR